MKKNIRFFLVGIAIVFIFVNLGCNLDTPGQQTQQQKAQVRFQNWTDFTFGGVKYGDAIYNGQVPPGFLSTYYETAPGTYSLQAKFASGTWLTISTGSLSVSGGHKYTIVGTGTAGVYFWNVIQDS